MVAQVARTFFGVASPTAVEATTDYAPAMHVDDRP
jgi:hypothetical protein